MSKKTYGIIGLVMLIAAVLVGLVGIFPYSVTAAGIYLVGSIAVFLIFVYAFCAKCPVRDNCTHVLQGMVTHSCPAARPERIPAVICSVYYCSLALSHSFPSTG
jgi:hypothetical membrane protein